MSPTHSPELVRRNFRIDLFAAICAGLWTAVLVGFMPVVVRRMGGTTFDVALVVAAPFIGHLLSPIWIWLLSGLPPVRVVAAAITAARSVFLVGVLIATTPLMLGVTTLAFWVITLANIAAYTTVMAAIYPDSERGQAMAKVRVGASVASVISAAVAGVLIDAGSATAVFAAATILSLPGSIAFFWIREEHRTSAPRRRALPLIAKTVWEDRRYRQLLLANSVFGIGNLMNVTIVPLMLVDHFDAPNSFVGALGSISALTASVAYLWWGRLIDRGSSLWPTAYQNVICFATPLTYLFAPNLWFLVPLAVVQGILNAGWEITYHTVIVQVAPKGRVLDYATAQSFLVGIRGTIAPFLASFLLGILEPRYVLFAVITVMVAGIALYFRATRAYEPAVGRALAPSTEAEPAES
ncbi:MAG: MFS transporter [Chloroflexi bacterium]|nr:MFS transporter [Chloroflexota bacterium]